MTGENHDERVIRLLKKDANRRNYIREYMKEYRKNKKEETGTGQKQYHKLDDVRRLTKEYNQRKTILNFIRFLFI